MNAQKILFALALSLAGIFLAFLSAMAACTISTTPMSFGSYDVFSSHPVESTGTVTYACDRASSITIALDRGRSPNFSLRQMVKGVDPLNYNLYLDPAHTTVWGDGTGGTKIYSDPRTPVNKAVTVNIYGRIPPRQNVRAGTYTNTVSLIINF